MSHASSLTDGVVENVSEHTGRGGFLGVLARSAGEVQSVALGVFSRVQHVGAMRQLADCIVPWRGYKLPLAAEAEGDLFHLLGLVNGAWFGGGHGGGFSRYCRCCR